MWKDFKIGSKLSEINLQKHEKWPIVLNVLTSDWYERLRVPQIMSTKGMEEGNFKMFESQFYSSRRIYLKNNQYPTTN